ncbi:MAG TPA: hypothetical protein VK419_16935, partial [Bryobacteraceae bacterium]|nr:hypothetical protein [Bryobacteraceae bacterium]
MLLPTTYGAALALLIVSMLCWGSWANTQKMAGKWRFELYYYDFSFGLILCAVIAAFTLGSLLPKELTFQDNFLIASKRQMLWAVGGGIVFNLANMLLVAAISVSGMAVAFPIGIGLALVIGVVGNYILNPQGNPVLLFGGAVLVVMAILVNAFAYSAYSEAQHVAKQKALQIDPRVKRRGQPAPTGAARGIILSIAAGLLMGAFYPMVEMGREGDTGVAPYGLALLFGAGVVLSTFLYVPFFLTFPVDGASVEATQYFKGTAKQHFLGLFGGMLWMAGGLCNFAAANTPATVQVGPAVSYALGQGATLVSALWGLLVWKEFKGASDRVKLMIAIML